MADTEPAKSPGKTTRFPRRQFLPGAVGLLGMGAGGIAGYKLHSNDQVNTVTETQTTTTTVTTTTVSAETQSFHTRPDLKPPVIQTADFVSPAKTGTSPRFIALSPSAPGGSRHIQSGPMIVDRQGRLVWFQPGDGSAFNLTLQSYKGQPVLAWWQGKIVAAHGQGTITILDGSYKTVKKITGGDGMPADLHDIFLTSSGTALVPAWEASKADLSSRGGSRNGKVWNCHILEVDLASGKVLQDWNSLAHIPVSDSYKYLLKNKTLTYDYFHLNSIQEMADGNLLISARNTWANYALERSTGKVLWTMGGKRSDFQIPTNAQFSWQHHVRAHGPSTMSVFDNGLNTLDYSRGMMLSFDVTNRTVSLIQEFLHPARFQSTVLGSVQPVADGRVFVGWGSQPYFSEYSADGRMLSDGEFPIGLRSYRAYLIDWVGKPTDKPMVVARSNPAGGFVVYASWNGATEIDHWTVLAGKDSSSLQPVGSQPWSGFETAIVVNATGPSFAVVAYDHQGNELGRSEVA